MRVRRWRVRWRWLVVAGFAGALACLPALIGAWPVPAAAIDLPTLYQRIQASASVPYQGYVLSQGTAGLPSLPQLGDVARLLNGATQLRVWYAGRTSWRVDQIDTGTERDLYQTPAGQYLWDFEANQLTLIVGDPPVRVPRGADLVPPDLARRLLAIGQPAGGADVAVLSRLPARRVAGIAAAGLRLTPTTPDTTVGHLDIWADPATGLPLAVQLSGRGGGTPVLSSRFLSVTRRTPPASVLTPPAAGPDMGFTVTGTPDAISAFASLQLGPLPGTLAGQPRAAGATAVAGVGVYGTGFAQFVVVPVPRRTGSQALDSATKGGGEQLDYPGGEGVLLGTPLLSVVVVQSIRARRSYLIAGMVSPALLAEAGRQLSTYVGAR